MRIHSLASAFLFLFFISAHAEAPARLQFIPDRTVGLKDETVLSFEQQLPVIKLDLQANQGLNGKLKLEGDSGVLLQDPPFDLELTISDLKTNISTNGLSFLHDAAKAGDSSYMQQANKLLGRPLHLHVDKDLAIKAQDEETMQLIEELPILREIEGKNFLSEIIQHIFSLAGLDLAKGQRIQKKSGPEAGLAQPNVWDYEILSITQKEIQAKVNGVVTPRSVRLGLAAEGDGKKQTGLMLKFTGNAQGEIVWDRNNSLLYHMAMRYVYKGTLTLGEQEWSVIANVSRNTSTEEIKAP